ncbi:MAG: hypothetical protein IPO95_16710 [Rhodanobacteraceae bacterium]|nr:hypothetical protein [Rhodanobacteraceae bacterium]
MFRVLRCAERQLSGLAIFWLGYVRGIPLFMGFAFVGIGVSFGTWRDIRRGPRMRNGGCASTTDR